MESVKNLSLKILTLGESNVGKSTIIERFVEGNFTELPNTIGISVKEKHLKLGNNHVTLNIFDTAGQERFRSLALNYYRNADGILLVYDITNKKTFERIKYWLEQIEENCVNAITIILLGNKIDLVRDDPQKRAITIEDGEKIAKEHNIAFFESSAKTNVNINESFTSCVEKCLKRNNPMIKMPKNSKEIISEGNKPKNHSCC